MTALLRFRWIAVAVLVAALTGCPQMFVYVPEGAESILPNQNPETSAPGLAAKPVFLSSSIQGGDPAPISAAVASYSTDQLISITTETAGATIYYTIDGTDPDPYDAEILTFSADSPIDRAAGAGTTVRIKAVALAPQMYPSEVADVEVTIDYDVASTPSITPASESQTADFNITVSSQDAGAQIWYVMSTSGAIQIDPVPGEDTLYTAPIPVSGHDTEVWIAAVATVAQKDDSGRADGYYHIVYPPPATPAGLSVDDGSDSSLTLGWNASAGATSYELYRDTSAGGSFTTLVYDGASLTATDTGLDGATTYYYKVLARGVGGPSTLSGAASGTTSVSPPAGVAASDGAYYDFVRITWSVATGATQYRVYRNTVLIGTTSNLWFNDTSGTQDTVYTYQVSSYNGSESALSAGDTGHSDSSLLLYQTGVLVLTFANAVDLPTPMAVTYDGTYWYVVSGGGVTGNRFARHFANGALEAVYAPGLDFRSITVNATGYIWAKTYLDNLFVLNQDGDHNVTPDLVIVDDPQGSAAFNGDSSEIYIMSPTVATPGLQIRRYGASAGNLIGSILLSGTTTEEQAYPDNVQMGTSSTGRIFTYSNGTVSEWDATGARRATAVIPVATPEDSQTEFSFSIANNLVAIYNANTLMWEVYDIGI